MKNNVITANQYFKDLKHLPVYAKHYKTKIKRFNGI